jgi:hypothetical protein
MNNKQKKLLLRRKARKYRKWFTHLIVTILRVWLF